jgi:hypothetical protein
MYGKIIAKCTAERWGYRKGDVLEVVEIHGGDYVYAKNLTAPGRGGRSLALLHVREFKRAREMSTLAAEYRLFGIPILRKYTREDPE